MYSMSTKTAQIHTILTFPYVGTHSRWFLFTYIDMAYIYTITVCSNHVNQHTKKKTTKHYIPTLLKPYSFLKGQKPELCLNTGLGDGCKYNIYSNEII